MNILFYGLSVAFVGMLTVFCALVNGTIIGAISKWLDSTFETRDALALRRMFQA